MTKMISSIRLVLILLVTLTLLPHTAHAQDNQDQNKQKFNPATFHGINPGAPIWDDKIKLTKTKARQIASTGTRAIRINFRLDGHETWTPALLKKYDVIIRTAKSARFEILGLVCNEATAGGQKAWNDTSKGANNKFVNDFAANTALLAERYKHQIKTWEIWNEPDAWDNNKFRTQPQKAGLTYILPEVLAHMLVETNLALRNTKSGDLIKDHDIKFVTGGLFAHDIGGSFSTSAPYLQELYNQSAIFNDFKNKTGKAYPWDMLGYHFYIDQGKQLDAKKLGKYLNEITKTARKNNDPSNMLITEFGWHTDAISQDMQSTNLAITYNVLSKRKDIVGTYWYQWIDEPSQSRGLVKSNIKQPKKALKEFKARCQGKKK
ncbi:hypothetical protein JD969_03295 [Planctomycetota bacterium]|nr:hypothetical protein JD969_03295 [Planctomycetota bacterium]